MLLREIERYYVDTRYELFTSTRSVDNIRLYEKLGYKIFDEKKITDELVFVYMEKMPVKIIEKRGRGYVGICFWKADRENYSWWRL